MKQIIHFVKIGIDAILPSYSTSDTAAVGKRRYSAFAVYWWRIARPRIAQPVAPAHKGRTVPRPPGEYL